MAATLTQHSQLPALVKMSQRLAAITQSQPESMKSDVIFFEILGTYYKRVITAKEEGKLVSGLTVNFPGEILYAMDVVPLHCESTMWTIVQFLKQSAEVLAAGSALGLSSEVCSAHRALAGAFVTGQLPRLDMMVWSNLVCDNSAKSGELLMKLNQCPGFFLDHPFVKTDEEIKYLAGELGSLVKFLEQQTGRIMNRQRFSEIIVNVNRQIDLTREIMELRKAVPTPLPFQSFLKLIMVDYFFPGQPEGVTYLEALRSDLAERVRLHQGSIPVERYRVMTLFTPPIFMMAALGKIFSEYKLASAVEPYFCCWQEGSMDPATPLESIAKKSFMSPLVRMYRPLDEHSLDYFVQAARDYKIDGAINFAHIGCRQTCGTLKMMKDTFNKAGLPILNIDCDIVDSTSVHEEDVRDKIGQFVELLEDR